jgi:hypothetical protein
MQTPSARWWLLAGAGLLVGQGCELCCNRPACGPVPPPPPIPYNAPPPGMPLQPAPQTIAPPAPVLQAPAAPTPVPSDIRSYGPPTLSVPSQATWRPQAGVTESTQVPREPVRLQAPEFAPAAPPKPAVTETQPQAAAPRGAASPPMPVGIPQYTEAMQQVTSGLKPLPDGLDWLKDNNFRTVLHIGQPGEDDSADRRQVEKRGMVYLSLKVSPQTLARTVVDDFNRIIGDVSSYPLFVYDRDGVLAGGLWYLHFRTVDKASDEASRKRAANLGLREDQNGEQKAMWLAIQKYLGEQKR